MLREKLNGIMVVAMVTIFTSCGVGSAPPQSGININICNSAGTTGDCSQEAANTNTAQISQPGGGGGIPPIPPIPPPSGDGGVDGDGGEDGPDFFRDISWLPEFFLDSTDPHADDNLTDDIEAAVDNTMPDIPDDINNVADGQAGSKSVDPNDLRNLFGDTSTINWVQALGRNAGKTVIAGYVTHPRRGFLLAHHLLLSGSLADIQPEPPAIDATMLEAIATDACTNILGVVASEIHETIDIQAELDMGLDFAARTVVSSYGNAHVTLSRKIGIHRVENSWCQVTVNRQGQITWADGQWTKFRVDPNRTLLSTTEVRTRILAALDEQGFTGQLVDISQALVYRPEFSDTDIPIYAPVIMTTVRGKQPASPTAERALYEFVTAVVE